MNLITFELDGTEYTLPDYISIENYVKVFKIKELFSDSYLSAKILNIVTGAPLDKLMDVNYNKINILSSYILKLFPTTKSEFIDRFELNGVQYGFISSWKEVSFAEYVDLDSLLTKKPNEILDYVHIISAIMYRPIIEDNGRHNFKIEKYDAEKMLERAELFKKQLDIKYFLGGQFFFIQFAKKFLQHIPPSSTMTLTKWQQIKIMWKMRRMIWRILLKKDLDGLQLSTELHKMMLQNILSSYKVPLWERLINYTTWLKKTKNLSGFKRKQ